MAELIPNDIYENIFLRLDVRNLISCKSVCKSWKSLISESQFFKAHIRWYNIFLRLDARNLIKCKNVCKLWKSLISDSHFIKDHLNHNENGHKRIGEAVFLNICDRYTMIGSSNGLVCIFDGRNLLVANPLTREVKRVPDPFVYDYDDWPDFYYEVVCGFGYDSLRDDYKVICGVIEGEDRTFFKVFSLKSNAWNVIGEVNYTYDAFEPRVGVLCNGAMHWVMHPENQETKKVILSFDLSKEEFKEIPQPDIPMKYLSLGIMEGCLCIDHSRQVWVMKKYNEKQSWEVVDNCQIKYEYPYWYSDYFIVSNNTFTGDLYFKSNIVESLVSPSASSIG